MYISSVFVRRLRIRQTGACIPYGASDISLRYGNNMIRQLTAKLIMLYLLILVGLFVLLNGVGSHRLEKKLMTQKKDLLVQEAQMIAGEYGDGYVNSKITTGDFKDEIVCNFLGDFKSFRCIDCPKNNRFAFLLLFVEIFLCVKATAHVISNELWL